MKLISRANCEMLLKSVTIAMKTSAYLLGAADGRVIAATVPTLPPKPSREQEMKLILRASCEMLHRSKFLNFRHVSTDFTGQNSQISRLPQLTSQVKIREFQDCLS